MPRQEISDMKLSKVYPLLVNKAERKGRTKDEVDTIIMWLLGYNKDELTEIIKNDCTYGSFFTNAPQINPNAVLIKGKICGISVESIEDPLMQKIRWLDKLIDELAKGKALDKILR